MDIIDRILKLMSESGVTAAQLTRETGLSNGLIYQWKTGKQKPTVNKLAMIAEYFGVSVAYLMGETEQKNKPTTNGELNPTTAQIVELLKRLTPEEQLAAAEFLRLLADKGKK